MTTVAGLVVPYDVVDVSSVVRTDLPAGVFWGACPEVGLTIIPHSTFLSTEDTRVGLGVVVTATEAQTVSGGGEVLESEEQFTEKDLGTKDAADVDVVGASELKSSRLNTGSHL